jgi:hypothetical protein
LVHHSGVVKKKTVVGLKRMLRVSRRTWTFQRTPPPTVEDKNEGGAVNYGFRRLHRDAVCVAFLEEGMHVAEEEETKAEESFPVQDERGIVTYILDAVADNQLAYGVRTVLVRSVWALRYQP